LRRLRRGSRNPINIPVAEILATYTHDFREGISVHTFKRAERDKYTGFNALIRNVYYKDCIEKQSLFIGQVITLFGEPDYWTKSYENIFSCTVSAEDNEGNILYFEIYHGPSGSAIGGRVGGEEKELYKKVADELAELIMSAKPTDYEWDSIYEDLGVGIKMGVKNGEPHYEDILPEGFWDN